ncbi:hypothetical protein PPL_00890 [Heterostelium album PN500]|uniref:Uncharacterized protein n=1 Tax=Heterostelium pallidum (strain ATCC 26659 / Pp 5 / PN500) TaxID=670386 RepID=D3AYX1_HETP5|nr:hypothetical protein PPL_00890 [Heterostelium album PN500]EFA85661.1 hypothetical protein PPL_00890 [Heterostelium album PN500]|eukprot:XP_020437768.1 hypothetical protein PPL_00890 [Heterostelium album PN500]
MGPKRGKQVKNNSRKKKAEEESENESDVNEEEVVQPEDEEMKEDVDDKKNKKNTPNKKQKTSATSSVVPTSPSTGRPKRAAAVAAATKKAKLQPDTEPSDDESDNEQTPSESEEVASSSEDEETNNSKRKKTTTKKPTSPAKKKPAANKKKQPTSPAKKKPAAAAKSKKVEPEEEQEEEEEEEEQPKKNVKGKGTKQQPQPPKPKPQATKKRKANVRTTESDEDEEINYDEEEEEEQEEIEMEFKKPTTPTKKKPAAAAAAKASSSQSQSSRKKSGTQSQSSQTPKSKLISFEPSKLKKAFNLKKLNVDRLNDEEYLKPEQPVDKLIKRLTELFKAYVREMVGGSSESELKSRKNEIILHLHKYHRTFLEENGIFDLAIDLLNPDAKIRKQCVVIVSHLFSSEPHLDEVYSDLFVRFLKRFLDTEKRIRMIMLEFANIYPVDSTYSDIVLDYLIFRLKDTEADIRAMTIQPVCEYIIKRTKLLTPKMLKNFYDRVRDKDSNVRKRAVVTLSKVWKALREKNGPIEDWPAHLTECFDCIPNVLFSCLSLHDDDRFRLEVAVDTILLECYEAPNERTEKFMEIYSYLDNKSKEYLFSYLERKRVVLKEFLQLVEVYEESPDDKKLIEKHIGYVDNFIPRYSNENTKTLLKQLLQPSNKKTLALLKDISDHNTSPQEQYKIKVAILEKASKSEGVFSEFIKYFAFLLNYTFISKYTLEFILESVVNDLPDPGSSTFDEKRYLKEKKKTSDDLNNSIEILLRVSKISPILFESNADKLINLLFHSKTISDNFVEIINNVVDYLPKLSKSPLKKLQTALTHLCQIGEPKIVKKSFRILVKLTLNKEELSKIISDLAEQLVSTLEKPKNVIATLTCLGLIARDHHTLIDSEMYELIEIFVYKGVMTGKSKVEVNLKEQWRHLDVQYSKEVLLKLYGIYYLGNYLRGLPSKLVTRKTYELATVATHRHTATPILPQTRQVGATQPYSAAFHGGVWTDRATAKQSCQHGQEAGVFDHQDEAYDDRASQFYH